MPNYGIQPSKTDLMMRRGDIVEVNLDPTVGREIKKTRPALVVSNNISNENSSLVTILPLTSKKLDRILRTEVLVGKNLGLTKPSKILCDQIRTIDKIRVSKILGRLSLTTMAQVDERILLHLGLTGIFQN